MDTNNHLNKIYLVFDSLNREVSLSFHFVNTFSDCFSFHLVNHKDADVKLLIETHLRTSMRCHPITKILWSLYLIQVSKTILLP